MIYWQISVEKYVPNHLIRLLYNFYFIFRRCYLIIKKAILKTYPPKLMILNVDYALKLSNYASWKRFICLKWILKNFVFAYSAGLSLLWVKIGSEVKTRWTFNQLVYRGMYLFRKEYFHMIKTFFRIHKSSNNTF